MLLVADVAACQLCLLLLLHFGLILLRRPLRRQGSH